MRVQNVTIDENGQEISLKLEDPGMPALDALSKFLFQNVRQEIVGSGYTVIYRILYINNDHLILSYEMKNIQYY